jgi:hypothetical protein
MRGHSKGQSNFKIGKKQRGLEKPGKRKLAKGRGRKARY